MTFKSTVFLILSIALISCSSNPQIETTQNKIDPNYSYKVYGKFILEDTCDQGLLTIDDMKFTCNEYMPIYKGSEVILLSKFPPLISLANVPSQECDFGDLCDINRWFSGYSYHFNNDISQNEFLRNKGYFKYLGVMGDFRTWKLAIGRNTYDIDKQAFTRVYFINQDKEILRWDIVADNIWRGMLLRQPLPSELKFMGKNHIIYCEFKPKECNPSIPSEFFRE